MIIWGSKVREIQTGSGQFYCPSCQSDHGYRKLKYARYFTLYFIPLFETEMLGENVVCGGCKGEFSTRVLAYTREQIQEATAPWACVHCNNRNPANTATCLSCASSRAAAPPPLPATGEVQA